ncbi:MULTISPECIES: MFS transporter [unclassified Streptomyces]|uniref:MFS transporter n=1 Tax=unclassified Streptomyces TaxID=2593676 RepID=UPI001486DC7D|nr:MFS transporter [Streptomyces sp. DASNCL29]
MTESVAERTEPSAANPPGRAPSLTLGVLALIGTVWGIMQPLVAPALPDIAAQVGVAPSGAAWLLTAFLLSAAIATPIIGRLGDLYGRTQLLLVTLALVIAGSVLDATAGSLGLLVAGRVLQGFGAGVFPLVFGIARDTFRAERVPHAIGLISVTLGIGSGIGVVLSGVIVDNLDYHWIFWLQTLVLALCLLATQALVPPSRNRTTGNVNWVGAALMGGGLAGILLAVSKASAWGWGSLATLGCALGGLVLLALWTVSERRTRHPLVDMTTLRIPAVWTTNLTAVLLGAGMFSAFVLIPPFAQAPTSTGFGFGASVTTSGLLLLPMALTMFVVGSFAGHIQHRIGAKASLVAGSAVSMSAYTLLLVAHDSKLPIYGATGVLGIGVALGFSAMANLIVQAVPGHQTGMATGFNTVARTVGSAVGSALAATLLANGASSSGPAVSGFNNAFLVAVIALALSTLTAIAIPTHKETAAGATSVS